MVDDIIEQIDAEVSKIVEVVPDDPIEDIKEEPTPDTPIEEAEPEEYSVTEQLAYEQGWIPKDEFDQKFGDTPPKPWVNAGEFIRRGDLFGKISDQRGEIDELKHRMDNMKSAWSTAKQAEYDRARTDIMSERDEALRGQDDDKAAELKTKMDNLDREAYQLAQANVESPKEAVDPAYPTWVNENKWYTENPSMNAAAETYVTMLKQNQVPFDNSEAFYANITDYIQRMYPEKFATEDTPYPKVPAKKPRTLSNRSKPTKGKISKVDLPEHLQAQLAEFKNMGMSEEDMIQGWVDIGEIE